MTAKEFLNVMKQAADFPKGMELLIEKYGEMLLKEHSKRVCICDDPVHDAEDASMCGKCGESIGEHCC